MKEKDTNSSIREVMIGTWAWGAGFNGSKMVFGKKLNIPRWAYHQSAIGYR